MGAILQDLAVGLRTFVRRPGFTLVATGTLALGIGAHAALFSVIYGVLLRPLDLPNAEELVVARLQAEGELRALTGPNAVDLMRQSGDVFASIGRGTEMSIRASLGAGRGRLARQLLVESAVLAGAAGWSASSWARARWPACAGWRLRSSPRSPRCV